MVGGGSKTTISRPASLGLHSHRRPKASASEDRHRVSGRGNRLWPGGTPRTPQYTHWPEEIWQSTQQSRVMSPIMGTTTTLQKTKKYSNVDLVRNHYQATPSSVYPTRASLQYCPDATPSPLHRTHPAIRSPSKSRAFRSHNPHRDPATSARPRPDWIQRAHAVAALIPTLRACRGF